jgi:hypothetical protein
VRVPSRCLLLLLRLVPTTSPRPAELSAYRDLCNILSNPARIQSKLRSWACACSTQGHHVAGDTPTTCCLNTLLLLPCTPCPPSQVASAPTNKPPTSQGQALYPPVQVQSHQAHKTHPMLTHPTLTSPPDSPLPCQQAGFVLHQEALLLQQELLTNLVSVPLHRHCTAHHSITPSHPLHCNSWQLHTLTWLYGPSSQSPYMW